jgi:uracil-DNA glycosylase
LRRDDGTTDTVAFRLVRSAAVRLEKIGRDVAGCSLCPRLVAWREEAAATAPSSHAGQSYWARPLPGWGDPEARLVLVGLAPAARGGNRTGRMFTGDRSGDFLFAALYRAGYANQPLSRSVDDGLSLSGAWVTAAVRCAPPDNKPTPDERATCAPFLSAELAVLTGARVLLALGAFAYEALCRLPEGGVGLGAKRARFAHGLELPLTPCAAGARTLLCSYHPSQRNVFTGLLTAEMFDDVLARARELEA